MSFMVNGNGKSRPACMHAIGVNLVQRSIHAADVNLAGCGESGDMNALKDLHTLKSRTNCEPVKTISSRKCEIADSVRINETGLMSRIRRQQDDDPWPQRDHFMELVDAKAKSGVSLEEIAQAIGLKTAASLETAYRYDRRRVPKRTTIQLAAAYFGVLESEIYGPTPDESFGNIMGILGKNLTEAQKAAMIEMAKQAQIIGREREAAEKQAKGEGKA